MGNFFQIDRAGRGSYTSPELVGPKPANADPDFV